MKKLIFIVLFSSLSIIFTSCVNDQYSIEKQYWQIQRETDKIFKNPHASPPQEFQRVVGLLNDFIHKFPQNILAIESEFNLAKLYMVKEEYEKARTQLGSLINKHNKSEEIISEALFLIGNTYEKENSWSLALEQYKKIIQEHPLTLRSLCIPIYIAQHYKVTYQPDKMINAFQEAISHYKQLSKEYPNSPLAFNTQTLVAECYMAMKEWQNAINILNSIIENYQDKINMDKILLNMALIYNEQLKDKIRAIETLQQLIRDYPKSSLVKQATELLKKWEKK